MNDIKEKLQKRIAKLKEQKKYCEEQLLQVTDEKYQYEHRGIIGTSAPEIRRNLNECIIGNIEGIKQLNYAIYLLKKIGEST